MAGTPDAGDAFEEDAFAVVLYQSQPQQRELSGAEIFANLMISLSYFICLLEKKKRHRRAVFLVICALNGIFLLPMVEGVNTFMDEAHSRAESESFEETMHEQRSAEATERALKMHRRNLLWAESDEEAKEAEVEEIAEQVREEGQLALSLVIGLSIGLGIIMLFVGGRAARYVAGKIAGPVQDFNSIMTDINNDHME